MNIIWGLLLAFQFLTRIPIPISCPWNRDTMRWALRSYALVGLCLGAIVAAIVYILSPWLPLWMLALLTVTLWVALTGGLHLDGWADTADAVGSYAPLDKKWEIMKDPRIGVAGAIALLFLLLWKIALVYAYLDQFKGITWNTLLPFIWIPALTRWGSLLLLAALPSVKSSGLAYEWKKHMKGRDLITAFLPIVLFVEAWGFLSSGVLADLSGAMLLILWLVIAYAFFILLFWLWVRRSFKAVNGDLAGAAIEGGELWLLCSLWIFMLFVME
ncbi:MAG: adenosylcobinamide-GDP ribazoletransferase [Paenibacillaceae bacterium]